MCMLEFARATGSRQLFRVRYLHVNHYLFLKKRKRKKEKQHYIISLGLH